MSTSAELRPLTALVVDDEPLARTHLRRLLEDQHVEVVGEAEHAALAIQLGEDLCPDLFFVDIQMPGLTGLQLAEALLQSSNQSLLIFITGYSEHATAAYEHGALDYLLKPVSPSRLGKTLARARARLTDADARAQLTRRVTDEATAATTYLQRLPIRKDYAVRLVRVEEIIRAEAREKRVFVRTGDGDEHRTYYTLTQLEGLLPPSRFLRIHGSCIVNLESVEEIMFLGNHTYAVRLSNHEQFPLARSRYAELQCRLGLDSSAMSPAVPSTRR
jgi:DNA-binding LytR/AlgR family response regulator